MIVMMVMLVVLLLVTLMVLSLIIMILRLLALKNDADDVDDHGVVVDDDDKPNLPARSFSCTRTTPPTTTTTRNKNSGCCHTNTSVLKTELWPNQSVQGMPVAGKTYLFKELYTETLIIRNPKKVGLFGYR